MTKINISQEQFDKLIETLNHRVTSIEISVKWLKYILGYIASLITSIGFAIWF